MFRLRRGNGWPLPLALRTLFSLSIRIRMAGTWPAQMRPHTPSNWWNSSLRILSERLMAKPHILFLNAAEGLGADVAVHAMLARTLDRAAVRVSAATNLW